MKRIKVAQIGLGHDHATCNLASLLKFSGLYEVLAIAMPGDEEEKFSDKAEPYSDIPKMTVEELLLLPGLEAVVIETEDDKLTDYALMAAERGLHVFMDKPGGICHEKYRKLITTLKEQNLIFMTGYMYRYNSAVKELIRRAKDGELGEIYSVEAHMSCVHGVEKRDWLSKYPGGMMHFIGCHLIDLILRIQGVPDEIIPLNTRTGIGGAKGEDFGMAVLKYKNGVSFAKTTAVELGGFYRRQLVVCGSKGTVELRPLEAFSEGLGGSLIYTEICEVDEKTAKEKGWGDSRRFSKTQMFERYDVMMSHFARLVRGEEKMEYSYEYEEQLHRVLLAACGEKIDFKSRWL